MPFFPQLSSGSIAQFPAARSRRFRTLLNETAHYPSVRALDPGAQRTAWELELQGLSDPERQAVEDLVCATSGMLRSFTFLDPFDNLLPMSEDYLAGVWQKEAGLIVTPGQTDPYGSQRASLLSNPTGVSRRMYQLLPLPCSYRFVTSVYLRGNAPAMSSVVIGPSTEPLTREFDMLSGWDRRDMHNIPSSSQDMLLLGVELPANTEIVIFGCQLEATLSPTDYKATSAYSGVHERCRLASDRLQWITSGVNNHSITLSVVTTQPQP